jgi:hypothetical protein
MTLRLDIFDFSFFQVGLSNSTQSSSSVVAFDTITIDHWSFNKQNYSFTAPVSGYYWMHISIGIPGGTRAQAELKGAQGLIPMNLTRAFTNFVGGPDTTSVGTVMYVPQSSNVYVTSNYPLFSDSLLQTAFGGYLLDSIMTQVVAFAFGQLTPLAGNNYKVPFTDFYIDTHQGWSTTTSEYVIPVAGTYIFAVSAYSKPYTNSGVSLYVNGQQKLHHSYC